MSKIFWTMLVFFSMALSKTALPISPGRELENKWHNINQVELVVSNYGMFGLNYLNANNGGCWWPKGSFHIYIYGAGSWFGTIDGPTGDTLVTIGYGTYGGEKEYMPGIGGLSFSDPDAVIFMYPENFPPPLYKYPMAPQSPISHQDSWCAYNDLDPLYHMPNDTRPIGLEVYQTIYAWNLTTTEDIIFVKYELKNISGGDLTNCYFGICADNDIGREANPNDRVSLVLNKTYVIEGDTFQVDNLGYQWQLEQEPVSSGIPAWWPGTIGFDYLQSPYDLVMNIDKDNDGILDQYEMDSAYFAGFVDPDKWDVDGDGTPDWRDPSQIPQLGMTAFKCFVRGSEPTKDYERYRTLTGRDFRTLVYSPFDSVSTPNDWRIVQASGPFDLGNEGTVTILVGIVLADWRPDQDEYLFYSPDSALARADAMAQYIYNMNWLLPGPPPPPTLTCIPGDTRVTLFWDNLPEMAPDPYFAVVGNPANVNLYDPFYQEYDFEGYGVWKSQTGQSGTWEVLARYDVFNNIAFDNPDEPDSTRLYATNTGLVHSYVDDDVRNGFTYYYAVSAYDYNFVRGLFDSIWVDSFFVYIDTVVIIIDSIINTDTFWHPDTFWDTSFVYDTLQIYGPSNVIFESGKVGEPTTPRRDPVNYVGPGEPLTEVLTGNPRLIELITAVDPVSPFEIDPSRPSYLEFYAPETATVLVTTVDSITGDSVFYTTDGVKYTILLLNVDNDTITSFTRSYIFGKDLFREELVPVDGIAATMYIGTDSFPNPAPVIDTIEVGGSYPPEYVEPENTQIPSNAAIYCRGFWAYRGNDYQITWEKTNPGGPVNTVEVLDLGTNELVSFKPFQNTLETRHLGESWCFTHSPSFANAWIFPGTDTLVTGGSNLQRTKSLYVNGCLIHLYDGQAVIDTIRPDLNDTWFMRANPDYLPAPVYGQIRISGTPGYFDTLAEYTLRVKVVPNPYIVTNEWQQTFNQRRVKFINLPNQCTIRIFNLNGELIKTIVHSETQEMTMNQYIENNAGGDEWWDLLSENRQLIASGLYIFHIQSNIGEQVGKFVVIR